MYTCKISLGLYLYIIFGVKPASSLFLGLAHGKNGKNKQGKKLHPSSG